MNKPFTIIATRLISPMVKENLREDLILEEYEFIQTIPVPVKSAFRKLISERTPHFIFTSRRAVKFFIENLREEDIELPTNCRIYCLSGDTKNAVIEAGMEPLLVAESALKLAQLIHHKGLSAEVSFFCSDMRRNDLPDFLRASGIRVNELVLYRTVLRSIRVREDYDGLLFFSPSAVDSFFMSNKLNPRAVFFCIGNTTANAVENHAPKVEVIIADRPTQENLFEKLEEKFRQKKISSNK